MSDEFQPFHAWLGLGKHLTNPNFYQLLGISPDEVDRSVITASAESMIRKLEAVPPGEHEPTRIRLVAQVNQARNCLLDAEQRRAYDMRLKAAIKAGLIDENGADQSSSENQTSTKPVPGNSTSATNESAWPPGHEPPSSDLPPVAIPVAAAIDDGQSKTTDRPSTGNPVRAVPASADPAAPAPAAPATSAPGLMPNPGIPVVSAPVEDDLPEPILPSKVSPVQASVTEPVAPQNPANPADLASGAVPDQPIPMQSTPVQSAPMQPVGQVPVAQPIDGYPIGAQPIAAQPIAAQPIAAQPIAAQPIAAQAGIAADPMSQPAPQVGAGGSHAAERYRTLRRRAQIKTAIGVLVLLGIVGVGGLFAYKYRDSWLTLTKSANFKDESAGKTTGDSTIAKIDPEDLSKTAAKSDSGDQTKPDPRKSDKTDSVLVPITDPANSKGTETADPKSAKKDDPEAKAVVPDDPKVKPDDPEMATKDIASPDDEAKRMKELASLGKLLVSAKQALFDRKLVEADQLIAKAEPLATSPENKEMVARLKGVADEIDLFWKTVIDECGKLQSLDEISMATSIIVVVESSPEKLVYRFNGERVEVRPIEMPIGLAMKIAERTWSTPTAETRMTRGAVYAIDGIERPANLEKARSIFEEAALVGGMVQPFLEFLEDDYDLVSALIVQEDVPDAKEVEAASEKLKDEYRKSFTSSDKLALVNQIFEDAPGFADLPSRMAAFDLAADLAAKNGEVPLLVEIVDTQAKWFNIDIDEVKASHIETAVKQRLPVEMAKELTRVAFELVDAAREGNNLELAARYAKVGVSAAAKSKDADLRKAASELNLQIREEMKDQK